MVVKPSKTFLTRDSDGQLIIRIDSILDALTGNSYFMTPPPSPALAIIKAKLEEFRTAFNAAINGGSVLIQVRVAKWLELTPLVSTLSSYVEVQSAGNLAALISSGFPIQKPDRTPATELPAPVQVALTPGTHGGDLIASALPVAGAVTYYWFLTTEAAPTMQVQMALTTAASTNFTGLTPGVVYQLKVCVLNAAGPSAWSIPVTTMAV